MDIEEIKRQWDEIKNVLLDICREKELSLSSFFQRIGEDFSYYIFIRAISLSYQNEEHAIPLAVMDSLYNLSITLDLDPLIVVQGIKNDSRKLFIS